MKNNHATFRNKIFAALILMTLLFVSVMAYLNFQQNTNAFKRGKIREIERIHNRIEETFHYITSKYSDNDEELKLMLSNRIYELSNVYNTNINIYNLKGELLGSNRLSTDTLNIDLLAEIRVEQNLMVDEKMPENGNLLYNQYSIIKINKKPVAILNTQNQINNSTNNIQSFELLKHYFFVVIFLLVISGFIAWFISKNLTKKIDNISTILENTDVAFLDYPLEYQSNDEIKPLVDSYNSMLSKLKHQTYLLQKNQREEAWNEMAKQVAHEINNPLTPLRLTVQNFQRKFTPDDPENAQKVKKLTESVIHQIDIISAITKSFTDFAKMPVNNDTEIDFVQHIKRSIDIFPPTVVSFNSNVEQLFYKMDSLYLTRIVTNIVKNGIQASSAATNKKVKVNLTDLQNEFIISIEDNGDGIAAENQNRVFENNFTTKKTGMGLGLSMVKKIIEDYKGEIWFTTKEGIGTTFFIKFPK